MDLGPALRREDRRLVENERLRVVVNYDFPDELRLVVGERVTRGHRARRPRRRRIGRRKSDLLPRLDPVAGRRLLAVEPELPGPRPARDDVEADLGHMPLEPPVEPNAVVILGYGEGAGVGHAPGAYPLRPQ